jgi:hypothetical protein
MDYSYENRSDILITAHEDVAHSWESAGGIAIMGSDMVDVIKKLVQYLIWKAETVHAVVHSVEVHEDNNREIVASPGAVTIEPRDLDAHRDVWVELDGVLTSWSPDVSDEFLSGIPYFYVHLQVRTETAEALRILQDRQYRVHLVTNRSVAFAVETSYWVQLHLGESVSIQHVGQPKLITAGDVMIGTSMGYRQQWTNQGGHYIQFHSGMTRHEICSEVLRHTKGDAFDIMHVNALDAQDFEQALGVKFTKPYDGGYQPVVQRGPTSKVYFNIILISRLLLIQS